MKFTQVNNNTGDVNNKVGQEPVPGGLMGMAGVKPTGTEYSEYAPTSEPMVSGTQLMRTITISGIICFALGAIVGILSR